MGLNGSVTLQSHWSLRKESIKILHKRSFGVVSILIPDVIRPEENILLAWSFVNFLS